MRESQEGVRYHLVMTFRLASINVILSIPLKDLKKVLCQCSRSQDSCASLSHSSMNVVFRPLVASEE